MFRLFIAPFLVLLASLSLLCAISVQSEAFGAGISYRYDSLNRLISVDYGNGMSIGYSYDATGNITRIARATGGADLILPTVTDFSLPATSDTLDVSVTALAASDNLGVTGYCISTTDSSSGCSWSGSAPATYSFPRALANGSRTLYAFAKDAAGNVSLSRTASVNLDLPLLSVTIATLDNGSGSVNSNPSGIACVSGDNANCSAPFDAGSDVTLIPLGSDSTFTGWSDACTNGSGNCIVTMDAPKSAIATFTGNPAKAVIAGDSTPYYSVGTVLDAVTTSGQTVMARDMTFVENVIMSGIYPIRLRGGYTDTAFTTRSTSSYTVIDGYLKIRKGGLRVERVKIR